MRSSKITGLVLALILGTAGAGLAQQPNQEKRDGKARQEWQGRRQQGGFGMLLKDIELTAEQKTQLQAIMGKQDGEARRGAGTELREQVKSARERGDTAALRQLRAQHVARMQQERDAKFSEIRAILTPAQQQTFDRNVADAKSRFEKRGGRMKQHQS